MFGAFQTLFTFLGALLLRFGAMLGRILGFFLKPVWGLLTTASAWLVSAFLGFFAWIRGFFGLGVVGVASAGGIGASILTIVFALQGIMWLLSLLFTVLFLFFGSDIASALLDLTPITGYFDMIKSDFSAIGSSFNSLGLGRTAFGFVDFDGIFAYFSFYNFFNLALSLSFGIVSLKLNIIIYRSFLFRRNARVGSYGGIGGGR